MPERAGWTVAEWDALADRLRRATTEIDALALKATNPNEKRRLEGKSEGVRLALSYMRDMAASR